jgi:hypothetical protein
MSTTTRTTRKHLTPEELLAQQIDAISLEVATSYTLADAIREGSTVTEQAYSWGSGNSACALSAAAIAARVRGYVPPKS